MATRARAGAVAAVARELTAAHAANRPVAWVRVTPVAVPGTIVTVPVTPERARRIELGRGGCPSAWALYHLEVLVHPDDWHIVIRERRLCASGGRGGKRLPDVSSA